MTTTESGFVLRFGARLALLLLCAACFAPVSVRGVTEAGPLSTQRVRLLRDLINVYFEKHDLDTATYRVTRDVEEAFRKADAEFPAGRPSEKPITLEDCRREAAQTTEQLVEERYAPLDREQLEAEAARLYPIYRKGQVVTVTYMANPVRPTTVRDVYRDRTPISIQVGRHVILIDDMLAVKGNEEEVLKFDAPASTELRGQYVETKLNAYQQEREAYEEKVKEFALRAEKQEGAALNEKMGYIFLNDQWRDLRDTLTTLVDSERQKIRKERIVAAQRRMEAKVAHIETVVPAQRIPLEIAGPSPFVSPDSLLAELQATMKQEAEAKAKLAAELEAKRLAEEEAAAAAAAAAGQKTVSTPSPEGPAGSVEEPAFFSWWFILILAAVVLGAVGGIGFWIWKSRQGAASQAQKFFKGRGKLQKDFWSMAEEDPDNFKYVAYRFPTIEEARKALVQLSYIAEATGGELKCLKDILFGFYPHQEKFVSFVGGPALHYALWREASAIFPELPGAEYFRVSPAPDVNLEIPDIEALLRDENLQVSHVENREGEGDDYSQYYVYRAPNKLNAIEFLKRVNVQEPGVHVLVETPEGTWGKDENGIYQE